MPFVQRPLQDGASIISELKATDSGLRRSITQSNSTALTFGLLGLVQSPKTNITSTISEQMALCAPRIRQGPLQTLLGNRIGMRSIGDKQEILRTPRSNLRHAYARQSLGCQRAKLDMGRSQEIAYIQPGHSDSDALCTNSEKTPS